MEQLNDDTRSWFIEFDMFYVGLGNCSSNLTFCQFVPLISVIGSKCNQQHARGINNEEEDMFGHDEI